MLKEKSPGLKILWLWTIGTAAVLVTSVVTTRLKDMEKLMNSEEAAATRTDSVLVGTAPQSDGVIREDKP